MNNNMSMTSKEFKCGGCNNNISDITPLHI